MNRFRDSRFGSPSRILLAGPMGAGKSTVGKRLAEITGWPYLDNDEMLLASTGQTARQLAAESGMARLHREERCVLFQTLKHPCPLVASIAASAVDREPERTLLAATTSVVYLRCRLSTLLKRMEDDRAQNVGYRPLFSADLPSTISKLQARRAKLYQEIAWKTVDADDLPPEEIAKRILAFMNTV